jgi:hypothetical protein
MDDEASLVARVERGNAARNPGAVPAASSGPASASLQPGYETVFS